MSKVATILLVAIGIIACPVLCRSGECCGGATELSAECATCCCCDSADCDRDHAPRLPGQCDKQCLCSGAVAPDLTVKVEPPMVSSVEPVPASSSLADGYLDCVPSAETLAGSSYGSCLNVRLLV